MKAMNTLHTHPHRAAVTIVGRRLQPGETLEDGDLYSAYDRWDPVPKGLIGTSIEKKIPLTIYIRPAEK